MSAATNNPHTIARGENSRKPGGFGRAKRAEGSSGEALCSWLMVNWYSWSRPGLVHPDFGAFFVWLPRHCQIESSRLGLKIASARILYGGHRIQELVMVGDRKSTRLNSSHDQISY